MKIREGSRDSFEVIKGFLSRVGERKPNRDEITEISGALKDIYERLMKVRAVAPTVDLSERMWMLMELAGIRRKPVRGISIRNAASFL